MYQPGINIQPLPVTREQFLRIPGETIRQGTYTQTDSPTKSSKRVRWVTLAEWNMQNDFLTFWNSLPNEEKYEEITNNLFLEQYRQFQRRTLADPTSEDMLSQHLDSKYSQLHNLATQPTPAISLPHSRIIRRDGFYQPIGNPDYIFVEQAGFPRTLYAVLELKTFWKVTPQKIIEVMNGTSPPCFFVDKGLLHLRVTILDDWQWNKSTDIWYATQSDTEFLPRLTGGFSFDERTAVSYT
jgi:hypothetical protein